MSSPHPAHLPTAPAACIACLSSRKSRRILIGIDAAEEYEKLLRWKNTILCLVKKLRGLGHDIHDVWEHMHYVVPLLESDILQCTLKPLDADITILGCAYFAGRVWSVLDMPTEDAIMAGHILACHVLPDVYWVSDPAIPDEFAGVAIVKETAEEFKSAFRRLRGTRHQENYHDLFAGQQNGSVDFATMKRSRPTEFAQLLARSDW